MFGRKDLGSRLRPDFVMLPDGSVGFYSRDSHDLGHEVDGVARLVIAEIKRVGVTIGAKEKNQPWQYVTELINKGYLTESAVITCYVLGSKIERAEAGEDTKWDGRVKIIPMTYSTFIKRAEKRMLGLGRALLNVTMARCSPKKRTRGQPSSLNKICVPHDGLPSIKMACVTSRDFNRFKNCTAPRICF